MAPRMTQFVSGWADSSVYMVMADGPAAGASGFFWSPVAIVIGKLATTNLCAVAAVACGTACGLNHQYVVTEIGVVGIRSVEHSTETTRPRTAGQRVTDLLTAHPVVKQR